MVENLKRTTIWNYALGIIFFFSLVHYWGFYEDAGRYLLQVVNYLHPERFVNDVPFMYGNQDSFTIYSPIVAVVFNLLGVNCGGVVLTLFGQVLWCVAAMMLMTSWCKKMNKPQWVLPLFVISVTTFINKLYGSGSYFPVIDHILVARFFAYGFMLLGLATFFHDKRAVPMAFFIMAFLFHPLIGGWALPLWVLYTFPKYRNPFLILFLLLPLTGFFNEGRFSFYTKEDIAVTSCFTPVLNDVFLFAFVLLFWLLASIMIKNNSLALFARSMFWVSFTGIYYTFVGAYVGHKLLFQAQPYRVLLLAFIPMIPAAAALVQEESLNVYKKYVLNWLNRYPKTEKIFCASCLLLFVFVAGLNNFIHLAFEQNFGGVDWAVALVSVPEKFYALQKFALAALSLLCFSRNQKGLALAFIFGLFNAEVVILPLVAMILFLIPSIGGVLKKNLCALMVVSAFFEKLMALPNSPLLENLWMNLVIFVMLYMSALCVIGHNKGLFSKIILALTIGFFCFWDVVKWDSRDESQQLIERQMDSFWDKPVFSQVKDRGRMLFVVSQEFPLQSRFAFLTGTYADETINIGEIFFPLQGIEANRRKNALLRGDSIMGDFSRYGEKIRMVYSDEGVLIQRALFLCAIDDISYFATDYKNIQMDKADSTYLNIQEKWVFLYQCPN